MTLKVVDEQPAQVCSKTVGLFQQLLAKAERGEIVGTAVVTDDFQGGVSTYFIGAVTPLVYGVQKLNLHLVNVGESK